MILASDSRLTAVQGRTDGQSPDLLFMDSGTKVHPLGAPNTSVAVAFFGTAASGIRSVGSLLGEWSREQGTRKTIETIAHELHAYLGPKGLNGIAFYVAGFDETMAFGRIFEVMLPGGVRELHARGASGISLGGRKQLAETVLTLLGPPLDLMPLKSSANLARWLIQLTVEAQSYAFGLPTVGGDVQIALLERGRPIRIL
jgi:hypothetical protein